MDLKNARTEINNIDMEIVRLLEKRFNVVLEIGQYKKENNIPIYDAKREKAVIENCISYLENKEYSKCIEGIYRQIMDSSKELEK
ncbi:MAG TPA: chorismate mutase [Clostridiales bacterium]|nr:chorismate mutase [Clostridiales bacterium]